MQDFDIAYSVVKLYTEADDGKSGTATSFFYRFKKGNKEKIVLITNKHVLEGVEKVTFYLHSSFSAPGITRKLVLSGTDLSRIVIKHPSSFDICALDIHKYLDNDAYYCLEKTDILDNAEIDQNKIMTSVFIVGYPNGLEDTLNKLPIFITGTTASSLKIDYNGLPMIVINAFALPGSSGSPIFLRENNTVKLLGIVTSGNILRDNIFIDNLCYAIKSSLILEIEKIM